VKNDLKILRSSIFSQNRLSLILSRRQAIYKDGSLDGPNLIYRWRGRRKWSRKEIPRNRRGKQGHTLQFRWNCTL